MSQGNNVNDNDSKKLKNNDNYNVNDDNSSYERSKQVEMIAAGISAKLGAKKESWAFLCKVAWTQPEFRIWGNVEQALKGKNPMGLFIYLSKRDGV